MIEQIKPELVERMVALVRDLQPVWFSGSIRTELDAIIAELPAPVDPDLLLAREVAAEEASPWNDKENYYAGLLDETQSVRSALAAIKRVRRQDAKPMNGKTLAIVTVPNHGEWHYDETGGWRQV